MDFQNYRDYFFTTVQEILAIDSPSGYCIEVIDYVEAKVRELGYDFERTNKGCGIVLVSGHDTSKTVALSAHVDTLGAMVRSIDDKGNIEFVKLGGPILPTLDGEYCKIRTREGKIYTGTFLSKSPAGHVHPEAHTSVRKEDTMYIRIDEVLRSKEDVDQLGIAAGDFIFIDPKTVVTSSGFLKSRFIDDKASVACFLTTLKAMKDHGLKPQYNTKMLVTIYEEVGHGASYLPADISEVLAVDMGCIGLDLTCTEYDVSICAKDSGGPYDYEMVSRLVGLAKENKLSYAVDIYPMYGSDVGAAWKGGNDVKGALIGTGVHASHGMERAHWLGIYNTLKLIALYLDCK